MHGDAKSTRQVGYNTIFANFYGSLSKDVPPVSSHLRSLHSARNSVESALDCNRIIIIIIIIIGFCLCVPAGVA